MRDHLHRVPTAPQRPAQMERDAEQVARWLQRRTERRRAGSALFGLSVALLIATASLLAGYGAHSAIASGAVSPLSVAGLLGFAVAIETAIAGGLLVALLWARW